MPLLIGPSIFPDDHDPRIAVATLLSTEDSRLSASDVVVEPLRPQRDLAEGARAWRWKLAAPGAPAIWDDSTVRFDLEPGEKMLAVVGPGRPVRVRNGVVVEFEGRWVVGADLDDGEEVPDGIDGLLMLDAEEQGR